MRFNMIITYTALCAAGLITAGCSSLPFSKKEEPKATPVVEVNPNKTIEVPASKGNDIPQWFLEREQGDARFITVTATDISKDMQFAIDKATFSAKLQLAERLKTDVSSVTRETSLESGVGIKDVEREIDRVSKTRIKQSIGFFKRENISVVREGDHYRAYVMFKISVEDARRLTHKPNHQSREDRMKELDEPTIQPQQPTGIKVSPLLPNN